MEDFILKHGDMTLEELQHWGIKGMKWGHRRFQNKDGSLTPAGEKRYNKEMERLEKEKGKIADANAKKAKMEALQKEIEDMKAGKITGNENKSKSVKDMSDDELRKAKNRLDMEREYQKAYDQANPNEAPKKNAVADFAKDVFKGAIKPALIESGKSVLTDFMKEQGKHILGLDKDPPPGSMEAFKKAFEKVKYQADIAENAARKTAYDNALKEPDKIYLKEKGDKTVIGLKSGESNNSGGNNKKKDKQNNKGNNKDNNESESKEETKELSYEDIMNRVRDLDKKQIAEDSKGRARYDYEEWIMNHSITFDDIEDLIHHGIKGQKWGVRRYQNQNGSLTPDGKKHRDEREGRNEFRVKKDNTAASGGKGSTGKTDKELSLEELKKRDLENGYVDEKGIITKAGHAYEKKRRSKLTEEETIAELKEVHEYHLKGDNNSPEVDYKGGKILDELYKYVGYGYMGPGITSETKKAYANLESVNKRLHKKRPSELNESEQNELISAYDEVSSAMLKGLGYKDLPDARKYIQYLWDYD